MSADNQQERLSMKHYKVEWYPIGAYGSGDLRVRRFEAQDDISALEKARLWIEEDPLFRGPEMDPSLTEGMKIKLLRIDREEISTVIPIHPYLREFHSLREFHR